MFLCPSTITLLFVRMIHTNSFPLLFQVHVQFTEKEDKITIEGPPEEVEQAQAKLKELAVEMVNKLTYTTLSVDPKHFKHIIGKNGANINRIKEQTGVVINILDTDQNSIRLEGDKDGVQAAKQVGILFI